MTPINMNSAQEVLDGISSIQEIFVWLRTCFKAYRDLDKILAECEIKARKIETIVRTFEPLHALGGQQSRILSDTVQEFKNIRDELSTIGEKVTNRKKPRRFVSSPGLVAKLNDIDARLALKNEGLNTVALVCTVSAEMRSNHQDTMYELRKTTPNFERLENRITELFQMKMVDDSIRQLTVRRKGCRIHQMPGSVHLSTGENLFYCKHGVRDFRAAARHFHAAANLGWSQAYYYLGMLYKSGWGVERCDVTCKNFFQMGADAKCPSAIAQLAVCYGEGVGVEKSPMMSASLMQEAAESGDPYAMGFYAWAKLNGCNTDINHSLAFKLASKAAKKNYAQSVLAHCYEQGIQVQRNPERAIKLYWEEIRRGSGWSPRLPLARMYERGDGVDVDYEKAAQLYKSGLQLLPWQLPYFQSFYGLCLIRGTGVKVDRKTGWALVQKSIEAENATGWYVRGECFRNGYGVEPNLVEAAACYRWATQMKNGIDGKVFSKYELGKMYENGQGGLPTNLSKAFDHYNYAARRMHQESQWKVASFSEKGTGVDKFSDRAAFYFGLAANSGHLRAQVKACEYYMKGKGISRGLHPVVQNLQPAVDDGDERAKELLRRAKIILRKEKPDKTESAPTALQWDKIFPTEF